RAEGIFVFVLGERSGPPLAHRAAIETDGGASCPKGGKKGSYTSPRMIRTEELEKHFVDAKKGVVRAVDGISIEARPGHVFGLLGVNGAGKTTMLRMLSTVIKPTSGKATVAGFDVVKQGDKVRAAIGF